MSSLARLTNRKYLTASIASENLVFYVVDKSDTTEDSSGSSFQVTKAELKAILGVDLLLQEKTIQAPSYADIPEMLAAQGTHIVGKIQHVIDATADVTVISGPAYYEFLGPPTGLIANYRKLSNAEVSTLVTVSSGSGFPIITIAARPFELRKTVNLEDASKATTLEVNDIILGTPAAGQWGAYRYEGGDNTDFNNNYTPIAGI